MVQKMPFRENSDNVFLHSQFRKHELESDEEATTIIKMTIKIIMVTEMLFHEQE